MLLQDWSDEGVLYDDNENFLNEVLDSNEKVQNLSRKLQVNINTINNLAAFGHFSNRFPFDLPLVIRLKIMITAK